MRYQREQNIKTEVSCKFLFSRKFIDTRHVLLVLQLFLQNANQQVV